MHKDSRIFVAGSSGLVGSAIIRKLTSEGYSNVLVPTHEHLDLLNKRMVDVYFEKERPQYVFMAAAKVGSLVANNTHPAQFIYENLIMQSNVIHAAYTSGVEKLLFVSSSCVYPRLAPQPIKEESLLTGPLEETNKAFAVAKIAGITMCQAYHKEYGSNFISIMSTSLYGTHDNFDTNTGHVIPSMIRKFHEAAADNKETVELWGTGSSLREFLFVDDFADACLFLMEHYHESDIINVGTGKEISIKELAMLIKKMTGFKGDIVWDKNKPDGTPRKLLDISRINSMGWKHRVALEDGLQIMYRWYLQHKA